MPAKRTPLGILSNSQESEHANLPVEGTPDRPRKRQRISDQENKPTYDVKPAANGKVNKSALIITELPEEPPRRRALPNFQRFAAAMTSSRRLPFHIPCTLPIIQSFVSSHTQDVYKIHSTASHYATFDLPTACSFTHQSKQGSSSPLLAVSTEDGKVEIINTTLRGSWDSEPSRTSFAPHQSAIFDVRWSNDDSRVVTACGDLSCRVIDVATSSTVATLSGSHEFGIKQVQWSPGNPNVLASGARDGNVFIWDLREQQSKDETGATIYKPVGEILHGHRESAKNKGGRKPKGRAPGVHSITSILYGHQRDDLLYSSTSANGIIKLWDLRQVGQGAQCAEISLDSTMSSTADKSSASPRRARGICNMALDPTGSHIYAVAADSRIHRYSALTLSTLNSPPALADPRLRVSSFYIRVAVSPCGQWLASGSSGGQVFVWSLGDPQMPAVMLDGRGAEFEEKETSVVDWAADGTLAACSDDRTVRIWRPDAVKAKWCQESNEATKWDWAVASS